jgi:hypothetical protein
MIIIEANDETSTHKINHHIENGDDIFMLIYMEGCGPCNAVRPEWKELPSALGHKYAKNNKLVIVDVNKDYAPLIKKIKQPNGFPTILYVSNRGDKIENFEDARIANKMRSTDSFVNWIGSHVSNYKSHHRHQNTPTPTRRRHHLNKTGGRKPTKTRNNKRRKSRRNRNRSRR